MLIAAAVTLPFLRKLKQTRATQIFTFAPALVGNRIYVGGARLNYAVQARCHTSSAAPPPWSSNVLAVTRGVGTFLVAPCGPLLMVEA